MGALWELPGSSLGCLWELVAVAGIISRIEETKDPNNQKTDHQGDVDLLLFNGASNVQNAATLASIIYPHNHCSSWC
jgi:hypothetical protein